MAPEIVKKQEYDPKASDIWAIGILTYRMLYGIPPFRGSNEKELYQKIIKGVYSFPDLTKNMESTEQKVPGYISEGAKDIINVMIKYEGKDRMSADELLKHDWFK